MGRGRGGGVGVLPLLLHPVAAPTGLSEVEERTSCLSWCSEVGAKSVACERHA